MLFLISDDAILKLRRIRRGSISGVMEHTMATRDAAG